MNQTRSGRRFGFFRKPARDLLPSHPVETIQILPWWTLNVGYVTEEDMKVRTPAAASDLLSEHNIFI